MGKLQENPAKSSQVLVLNPSTELTFRGDFREVINVDLSLSNPTNRPVAFKVKTNYPHRYFVKPNGGLIEPTQQQIVTIMLQPLEFNNAEMKLHKFMVQSMFAPSGPLNGLEKLWKLAKPEDIMDTKIRCTFEQFVPVVEELPRHRGAKEQEGNGFNPSASEQPASKGHATPTDSNSSTTVIILVVLVIIFLIAFAYLKSK